MRSFQNFADVLAEASSRNIPFYIHTYLLSLNYKYFHIFCDNLLNLQGKEKGLVFIVVGHWLYCIHKLKALLQKYFQWKMRAYRMSTLSKCSPFVPECTQKPPLLLLLLLTHIKDKWFDAGGPEWHLDMAGIYSEYFGVYFEMRVCCGAREQGSGAMSGPTVNEGKTNRVLVFCSKIFNASLVQVIKWFAFQT